MKILEIAPHTFTADTGTPLSVFVRTKALSELGHSVDVVCYHMGKKVDLENVRLFRIWNIPFIKHIKSGPSLKKFFLDIFVIIKTLYRGIFFKYDAIYTHEEGALFGAIISKIKKIPHVYDMHSSIPSQIKDRKFTSSKILLWLANTWENFSIRFAHHIIVIGQGLKDYVHSKFPGKPITVIPNTTVISSGKEIDVKKELGIEGKKIVLYTGSFIPVQGLDLMLDSIPTVIAKHPNTIFLFVGGRGDEEMNYLIGEAKKRDVLSSIMALPIRPKEDMPSFMKASEVLTSSRTIGINPPLKLLTYLQSGKPIVATNTVVNNQLITKETSILTEPTGEAFGEGINKLLDDPELCKEIGNKGIKHFEDNYSYESYLKRISSVFDHLKASKSKT